MHMHNAVNPRYISKRTRFAVLDRDEYKCVYCGDSAPDVKLVVDHVIPVAKGGSSDLSNLVTACEPCNQGKTDRSIGFMHRKPNTGFCNEPPNSYARVDLVAITKMYQETVAKELGWFWYNQMDQLLTHDLTFGEGRTAIIVKFLKSLDVEEIQEYMRLAIDRIECYATDDAKAWQFLCRLCSSAIKDTKHGS